MYACVYFYIYVYMFVYIYVYVCIYAYMSERSIGKNMSLESLLRKKIIRCSVPPVWTDIPRTI